MIRMIATDLDGTLLSSGGREVHEKNRAALAKAAEAGVKVVICSGRLFTGALRYALIAPGNQPMVCVNGAQIRMSRTGEYLFRGPIREAEALAALLRLKEAGMKPWFYIGDACFAEEYTDDLDKLVRRTGIHAEIVASLEQKIPDGPDKILGILPEDRIPPLQESMERDFAGKLYVTRALPWQIEIMAPGSTKGKALQWLARQYGIARNEIAVFGDNYNDLEMFSAAGVKVAMRNGVDALKEQADIIAPANDEGGVGQVLEDLLRQA